MSKLSVISKAQARRLLTDPSYRRDVFGSTSLDEWDAEWLARIAGGWVACSGPRRHRGTCSEARPELGGLACIEVDEGLLW